MDTAVSPPPCSDGPAERQEPRYPQCEPLTEAELAELRAEAREEREEELLLWLDRDSRETRRASRADFEAVTGHRPVSEADRAFVDEIASEWTVQRLARHGSASSAPRLFEAYRRHAPPTTTRPRRGRCEARPSSSRTTRRTSSSSRGDPDLGDEPEPPQGGVDESVTTRHICGRQS